jgi:hypothetical protein
MMPVPPKMLVPKDFDFNKQFGSYFPVTGHERTSQSHSVSAASVSRGQHNGGDGADRAQTTSETKLSTTTTTTTTGEQARNDRRTET